MDNKVVGKCTGKKDIRHKDCGGQISVGGVVTHTVPMGLGFRGNDFVVDKAVYTGYDGFCLKCHAEGIFMSADVKPKIKTSKPRGINSRIRKARKEMNG